MITRLVRLAFSRLEAPAMAVASEVAGTGNEPTSDQVNRFVKALVDTNAELASAAKDGDKWIALNSVVKDLLKSISKGVGAPTKAFTAGSMIQLVNLCKAMMDRRSEGTDVTTKSPGIKAELEALAGQLTPEGKGDQTLWNDVHSFVKDKFSGYTSKLVGDYLATRPHGEDKPRSKLMSSREADAQIMKELFDVVVSKLRHIVVGDFDFSISDAKVFNTIMSNVANRIQYGKVDDRWFGQGEGKMTGIDSLRRKWMRYVMPLRGTELYPGDRADLRAVREWINGNFYRKDMKSQTMVQAQSPGGGTVTAPSFKTELTERKLLEWMSAAKGVGSIDAPVGEDGATVGESIKAPEQREDEEKRVEHLNAPAADESDKTRRDVARDKLRAMVKKAVDIEVREGRQEKAEALKKADVIERIMLIKLGLGSGSDRGEFRKKTLEVVEHMPFRSDLNEDEWKEQGKPPRSKRLTQTKLKSGEVRPPDPADTLNYVRDFDQKTLVWKAGTPRAGEQFTGTIPTLRSKKDNLEPDTVTHKAGDPVDMRHFRDWSKYSQEDREADLDFALDVYDGRKWYQHSIDPEFRRRLAEEDADLSRIFEGFDPMTMMTPFSWGSDKELLRALGQVLFTPQASSNSLNPIVSGIWVPLDAVHKKLGEMLKTSAKAGDYLPLEYLALKGSGAIASSHRRPPSAERIVKAVVECLMCC